MEGSFVILLNLEYILLILKGLVFLVAEFGVGVIMAVKVDQFVITLGNGLLGFFDHFVEFFDGCNDSGIDQIQFRLNGIPKIGD